MQKHYSISIIAEAEMPLLDEASIEAQGDLGALEIATRRMGPEVPFILWEGSRRVCIHMPAEIFLQADND